MQFLRKAAGTPARVAILAGTFHPVTVAHLALGRAALRVAGEVVFLLPQTFPHKAYVGASFQERAEWLLAATCGEPGFSVAAHAGGLFIDIARACLEAYPHRPRISFVCGTDAAQRIVEWDYGDGPPIAEQFGEYDLLVADRAGRYVPPRQFAASVEHLPLDGDYQDVSATEVRERIAHGLEWEHLVPETIVRRVREILAPRRLP